jgi:hypothetical protein
LSPGPVIRNPEASAAGEVEGQVPPLLGDPSGVGVSGGSGHVDPPRVKLNHEDHVGPEPDGLDGEEVGRQDPVCLVE